MKRPSPSCVPSGPQTTDASLGFPLGEMRQKTPLPLRYFGFPSGKTSIFPTSQNFSSPGNSLQRLTLRLAGSRTASHQESSSKPKNPAAWLLEAACSLMPDISRASAWKPVLPCLDSMRQARHALPRLLPVIVAAAGKRSSQQLRSRLPQAFLLINLRPADAQSAGLGQTPPRHGSRDDTRQ